MLEWMTTGLFCRVVSIVTIFLSPKKWSSLLADDYSTKTSFEQR
jgi:hypothetical protein